MGGGSSVGRPNFTKNDNNRTLSQYTNNKKKVFISYSMRNKAQVGLLRHQIKDDNFDLEFVDTSLKRPVKNKSWKPVVGRKIRYSDVVICMVGDDTHSRNAVSWEINYAKKNNINVIPVKIHKDHKVTIPKEITYNSGKAIPWKMEEIQDHINKAP